MLESIPASEAGIVFENRSALPGIRGSCADVQSALRQLDWFTDCSKSLEES